MTPDSPAPRPLHTLGILALVLLSGAVAVRYLGGTIGVSRLLFGSVDIPGMALAIWVSAVVGILMLLIGAGRAGQTWWRWLERIKPWHCALACLLLSGIGVHLVYSGYALSLDEWMPRMQAQIFATGQLTGTLPEEWQPFGHAMIPSFASFDARTGEVASNYRPGMAAFIALFDSVGLGLYVSAVLNAVAVLLVARVTRQIWPDAHAAPVMAAILLASSSQAMAASLTSYAMTAHLCFNLLWLHLFLRGTVGAHVLAALVGVLTASLHQIHAHLFFALPFFVLLLNPLRIGIIAIYAVIYLAGHLAVIAWDEVLIRQVANAATNQDIRPTFQTIREIFRLPDLQALASIWANLTRLIAWQNLALLPLLILLWRAARTGNEPTLLLRLLGASIGLSLVPYLLFMPDQGHGWGYRYLHGLLGHFAILAALGWHLLDPAAVRFRNMVALLIIGSVMVMLPFRAWQIERFVTPYARATDLVYATPSDVVIIDNFTVFVGQDIARNAPGSFQEPAVMIMHLLTPEDIQALCAKYQVTLITGEQLAPLGVPSAKPEELPPQIGTYRGVLTDTFRSAC